MGLLVKICGINSAEAADAAARAGADLAGLVFHPKSPRNLSLDAGARARGPDAGQMRLVVLLSRRRRRNARRRRCGREARLYSIARRAKRQTAPPQIRARFKAGSSRRLPSPRQSDLLAAANTKTTPTCCCSTPNRRTDAERPGGHGGAFDWQIAPWTDIRAALAARRRLEPCKCRARHRSSACARSRCFIGRRNRRQASKSAGADRRFRRPPRARTVRERGTVREQPLPIPSAPVPTCAGHFGAYGGRFVAETLMPLVLAIWRAPTRRPSTIRRSRPNSTDC